MDKKNALAMPDYYGSFSCTADRCAHNCCIGWEIDIDEDTYRHYMTVGGEIGDRLRDSIDSSGGTHFFRLGRKGRCPFLNGENLCDIIIELGEDRLCEICAMHPRFRNFFSDRTEIGIGLACEAAAELIVNYEDRTRITVSGETAPRPEEEGFFALRERIFEIVQDRGADLNSRIAELLHQCAIKLPRKDTHIWREFYMSLERLDPKWDKKLKNMTKFRGFPENTQTAYEQLIIYFLYRNMADGLYDGTLRARIAFAIHAAEMICRISGPGAPLSVIADTARMYSAEIEYCDDSMQTLLEVMYKAAGR